MFEDNLPLSTSAAEKWRRSFWLVSGGRLDGPSDRCRRDGPAIDASDLSVRQLVLEKVCQSDCVCITIDVLTDVNAKGVYNFMSCTPTSLLLGFFRMALLVCSSENWLAALKAVLSLYLLPTDMAGVV